SGSAATIVIVTPSGATVGVPPSVLRVDGILPKTGNSALFYQVARDGVVTSPQGIVLVEEGGIAGAPSSGVSFVKNGGTLLDLENFSGMLFHEPRADLRLGPARRGNSFPRLIQVPAISASIGIEPFVYARPDPPESTASAPPRVKSVHPDRAPPG